ncbi:uncharacterized protein LOC107047702 [Diachasma alloeum]|uniref:uncharacterized protein LOC107047702 n=1 Tax=Diachasma alloeum TaxID=454923 RepID=UPI0010FB6988|nr:uncharacterized protein LOC107047702 [Diachasma alloeum]
MLSLIEFIPRKFGKIPELASVIDESFENVRKHSLTLIISSGSCENACVQLSGGTASPYTRQLSVGLSSINTTCICQCKSNTPIFREDLNICVSDIHECSVAGFLGSSGAIEKVPYVFLPQCGQIVYPQAEILFEGVKTPVCGIVGAQQLGKPGWSELRNLSSPEPPFRLFRDEGRAFLRWTGEAGLREAAEGKVVVTRLTCRDADPNASYPGVFTPCVAFRIAGSPSKSVIREVSFASSTQGPGGLSSFEYTAIGISSVLLALIYVVSVSLYLHSQKSRRKKLQDPEIAITAGREGTVLVKSNPLLASRHFESDSNSVRSESDHGEDLSPSDTDPGFEKVTSAVIHPQTFVEQTDGPFGSPIIGERIPDEDVRIVETFEGTHAVDSSMLPGVQRRKLYFNPAYFERQFLLAPPPAAIEFLLKIREVISIAKHKMAAKRFVPSLSGIPEEESTSGRCSSSENKRAGSVQESVARSRKSQRCTGCPGCTDSRPNPPILPDNSRPIPGESRVRAWLADVKPPERRWRDLEDHRKNFQENVRTFARSLEHLRDPKNDFFKAESRNGTTTSLATWKDNPPMLRTFQHIARSEIMGDDDQHSISRRSTKSMFEDTNYDRFCRTRRRQLELSNGPEDFLNAKVRKAIENSFIKQMEENAALENAMQENERRQNEQRFSPDGSSEKTNKESLKSSKTVKKSPENTIRRKKSQAPPVPTKDLPDMIPELPTSKFPVKTIMDAVIKEMVVVKALEHHHRLTDYEVDSLERTNRRKREKKPVAKEKESPSSTLTPQTSNEIKESEVAENEPKKIETNDEVLRRNYYNTLPELISQRPEGYSLVSEVYVNDGYASPANSDDSSPEISYEPENPGHLTIKVQDSPDNYVKQDESEYEPDTLDRKPMKLKINGDVIYEKGQMNESFVDSLERPAQILLRSKGSFRDDIQPNSPDGSLSKGYGSLREIYEAKLHANAADSNLMSSYGSLSDKFEENGTWKSSKYLTPDQRQARRQRKQNQPDVVPLPPTEGIYEHPKPPRRNDGSKNERDRSSAEAGAPTAGGRPPVRVEHLVGMKTLDRKFLSDYKGSLGALPGHSMKRFRNAQHGKVEDSGYLSSTDSNESQKQAIKYDFGSVSETDETESICDGASESGAESVGTDSVFFGNFRRLSHGESFTKSMDSGVDIGVRSNGFRSLGVERQASFNTSDSENESFVTVLPHGGSRRNSLVL